MATVLHIINSYCIEFIILVIDLSSDSFSLVPLPPTDLKAVKMKTKSITVSWVPRGTHMYITSYQVSITPHDGSEHLHDVAGNTSTTELTSLTPRTEYTIRVRAKSEAGCGDYSEPIVVTTPEDGKPN